MAERIALISLGCAKNLINSEQMLYLLAEAGYELVTSPAGADAVIVNTCGFIDSAKEEAIGVILEMAELKKHGELGALIVTGCLSERYREEMLQELPEIDALVGVGSYEEIVTIVKTVLGSAGGVARCFYRDKNTANDDIPRAVTTGPGWAYLKIAEGCDNRCSYCVIPGIRGRYRSRKMENIIEEAKLLAASGVKELIVIAQDITRYGMDFSGDGKPRLRELLEALCAIDGIEWIRLHYLYPELIDDALIACIAKEEKIVKYLDIPIQHINSQILRKMNRRGDGELIRALFRKLRERIPNLVLRTSLITGLPYEGEAEFEELTEFLREAKIERAGVFPFSPEEGTPAAAMPHPEEEVAARRAEQVMELQSRIMDDWCASLIGQTLRVLCEGYDAESECWVGRSWADSPEVDGKVYFTGEGKPGCFAEVEITGAFDGDLTGESV